MLLPMIHRLGGACQLLSPGPRREAAMAKTRRKPVITKPRVRGPRRRKAKVRMFRIDGPILHLDRLAHKFFKRR